MRYNYRLLIKFVFGILFIFFTTQIAWGNEAEPWEVQGVRGEMLMNVNARLHEEKKKLDSASFYKKAPQIIKSAIAPFGYFDVKINTSSSNNSVPVYIVRLGQPVRIEKIDIRFIGDGKNDAKLQAYLLKLPIKKGDIFNTNFYNQTKEELFEIANDQGYIHAVFTKTQIDINTQKRIAHIFLYLDTKKRFYFGKFFFNRTAYRPDFLNRFIQLHRTEPFSSKKLIQLQADMNSSRYFKQVLVMPQLDKTHDQQVPVEISVVPVTSRSYNLGIGYGTFTGPRFTGGIRFQRLTDTGHSFEANLKLSSVSSGLAARYAIPGNNPLTQEWTIGSNVEKFSPKNGRSTARSIYGGYSNKMNPWVFTANINYLFERFYVDQQPSQNSELFYPNFNAAYLKADSATRPRNAKSFSINLRGASQQILSSANFIQGEVQGKYLVTPFDFAQFIFRADLGYTVVNDLNNLPLSIRFFAGGINSIRGFPDSSIGPGRYLQIGSAEYRHRVTENWSGALFYDMGNASNNFFGQSYNRGAGVGVIYESIIGPVRLYVARAISKPNQPYQIEFSVGPEF